MHMEAVPRASQEVKEPLRQQGDQAKQTPGPRPTYGGYQFNEEEVDWEHDDVEDDRTPEEKQEDAEILRQTKENMAAFLRAPPELKRTLRSQLWQCCCEKLRTLCLDPTPCHPHEGKFEACRLQLSGSQSSPEAERPCSQAPSSTGRDERGVL